MNICRESQELLSALYDGEPVPGEVADHVHGCANCRAHLREYSDMGAELRLLACRASSVPMLPAEVLYKNRSRRSRLLYATGKIMVPKFAVAAAAAFFLVMTAGLIRLHAQQSSPLWFQFTLSEKGKNTKDGLPVQYVAQAGYDGDMAGGQIQNVIATHIIVSAIQADRVELAVRSRLYHVTDADDMRLKTDLKTMNRPTITYHPGESLEIPIEGGGTLILEGTILDHKPRFMEFGIPLEPNLDQLILTSPVLIRGERVLFNMRGANTTANGPDQVAVLFVPGTGLLRFGLAPFPGAIQGVARWGNLDFKLNGQTYMLLTSSQIAGGDQPRTVWIGNKPDFVPEGKEAGGFVSSDKLSSPAW